MLFESRLPLYRFTILDCGLKIEIKGDPGKCSLPGSPLIYSLYFLGGDAETRREELNHRGDGTKVT